MKKNKHLILIIAIFSILILYFNLRTPVINVLNNRAIEKKISKNYPEYEIIDRSYEYLDTFWSTYYQTANDSPSLNIICNITLKNKKTGMYVTIPMYHSKYGIYKDGKNMKQLVNKYEKFWNEVNDLAKKNGIDIHLSNAKLFDGGNCDITELIVYIKEDENKNIQDVIDSIDKIDSNLVFLSPIYYIVAKENTFEDFSPWIQSNRYEITLSSNNSKVQSTESKEKYDFYETFKLTDWIRNYYLYN